MMLIELAWSRNIHGVLCSSSSHSSIFHWQMQLLQPQCWCQHLLDASLLSHKNSYQALQLLTKVRHSILRILTSLEASTIQKLVIVMIKQKDLILALLEFGIKTMLWCQLQQLLVISLDKRNRLASLDIRGLVKNGKQVHLLAKLLIRCNKVAQKACLSLCANLI